MKKYLLAIVVCACFSCGGNNQGDQESETDKSAGQLDGAKLISKSDCMACHSEKQTIIGPSYQEIAAKYPKNDSTITYLAGKIINGGSGNWGTTPMPPHPQHSTEEAKAMATFIMSLHN